MFGVIVNGRPVITNFTQVDPARVLVELPQAETVHDIGLFLLPGFALPPAQMACLYASLPPFSDWNLVSSVTADAPSVITRMRWREPMSANTTAQLGVSIEERSALQPAAKAQTGLGGPEDTKEFAKAIATDLFRFLDSYGHSVGPEAMAMLDKWYTKFSAKMDRNPNHWQTIRNRD